MENNTNIFKQFQQFWSKLRAGVHSSERDVERLSNMHNPETSADEVIIVVKIILGFSIAFTIGFGTYYYYLSFLESFGSVIIAGAASFILVASVETAKIALGLRSVRSVFFGYIFRDGWGLLFWLCVIGITTGAYVWSYKISTTGMTQLVGLVKEMDAPTPFSTKGIDDKYQGIINKLSESQGEALKSKWKGNTTIQALRVSGKQSTIIANLQKQWQSEIQSAQKAYDKTNNLKQNRSNTWAGWLQFFGGKMEIVSILCLFITGLFQRILYNANKEREHPKEEPKKSTFFQIPNDGNVINNKTEVMKHTPIGFFVRNQAKTPYPTDASKNAINNNTTVQINPAQPVNAVPQQLQSIDIYESSTVADAAVKQWKQKLQREPSNLKRVDAKPETVVKRMDKVLTEAITNYSNRGFQPRFMVNKEFAAMLREKIIPVLPDGSTREKAKELASIAEYHHLPF